METKEKTHSKYGSSNAEIWVNCHGYMSLMENVPYEPPGIHANRGTALHTGVLEVKTQREIDHRITGKDLLFDYSNIKDWPEEGPELADEFWNILWVNELEQFITGKTILIEKRLTLFSDLDCSGIADIVILYYSDKGKLVAVIGDCKFGKIRQGPDKEQFKFLLTALNKMIREKGKQIDEFRSFVYQPTHDLKYEPHKFTKSEIEKAEIKYEKAIIESKKDNPKFKVGDWCTYCKAQGRCNTYKKHLDKEMEMMVIRNQNGLSLIPPDELPAETKAKIAFFSDKLVKYFKEVKKSILLDFMNKSKEETSELRKYIKITEGRSNRVYKDENLVIQEMQTLGINPFKDPEIKGLGAMESSLVQIGHKKSEAKKIVDSFTEKPYGKPKITTADSDKEDYVFNNTASLLDDFEDE